ncbi:hypothetical protein ACFW04_013693 [Cataglyphis niger]
MSVRCRWCGIREFIFRHDPVKQFVDFSTRTTKCFKQIICIAHNAKAFDAQFILKHTVENRDNLEPKVILNGTKNIVLTVGHTKFIDSVNYMSMRLFELPKAFGLQDTSDKGIFPHLFNTENQSYISPRGYLVTEKWECVFNQDMRDNHEMHEYLDNHPMVETPPLDPRDAFFGGRTRNIVTRYEITGTEKIYYVDVCFLYVLKTVAFPIGHPDIYVSDKCSTLIGSAPNYNFDMLEGLIRYKILFPRDLFYPVLPYRMSCTHENASEREFEGTWVYPYLRITRGGLFAEYINTFLKFKQEASGWPSECGENDDDGIVLDRCNVARNPGLRSVVKLCLNSFWGKFGQRSNLPNTEIVRTPQRFMTLLTSAEHEITDILPVNDEIVYVSWRIRCSAYTTAQARLKLYSYLECLNRRVLYYDTDSCIYKSSGDPHEYVLSTGNFLGDMTDELESYSRGSYIEAFVSGGPKFYVYVVRTPDSRTHKCCKIKGIILNYKNSQLVNFNSIKNLLIAKEKMWENKDSEEVTTETSINLRFKAIRRKSAFHEIITRDKTKKYALLYYLNVGLSTVTFCTIWLCIEMIILFFIL